MCVKKCKKTFFLIIFINILFCGCSIGKKMEQNVSEQGIFVRTCKAQNKVFNQVLEAFGTISFKKKNDVTVLVSGKITSFNVKEGDFVKKGEVVAILKNLQLLLQKKMYESEVEAAQARVNLVNSQMNEQILGVESRLLAVEKDELNIKQKELELSVEEKNLGNKKRLNEIGGITDAAIENLELSLSANKTSLEIQKKELEISMLGLRDIDLINAGIIPSSNLNEKKAQIIELNTVSKSNEIESAKAALNIAKKQLENAQLMMDELIVKAPCDGIIGQNYYENGEYINENQKLTTIIDISTVYAQVYIQEQDIVKFKIGSIVYLEIPSLEIKIKSEVSEISPIASSQSGNFLVKIKIPNSKKQIKPGMFVKARIEKEAPQSLMCLPETAVLSINGNSAEFFIVQNSYLVKKTVEIIDQKEGCIWFENGITDSEIVVDKPSAFLREGQKVSNE